MIPPAARATDGTPLGPPRLEVYFCNDGVAIYAGVNCGTNPVVVGRGRQNLDLVIHRFHALYFADYLFGAGFKGRSRRLPHKHNRIAALNPKMDVVKNSVLGQRNDLLANFLRDSQDLLLVGARNGRGLFLCPPRGNGKRQNESGSTRPACTSSSHRFPPLQVSDLATQKTDFFEIHCNEAGIHYQLELCAPVRAKAYARAAPNATIKPPSEGSE